jgi:hypothetical protein
MRLDGLEESKRMTAERTEYRKRLLIAWTYSSIATTAISLAWAFWHLTIEPADYTAEQVHTWAAIWLVLALFLPFLALSIVNVVETSQEIRTEKRERPERERRLDEAMAAIEKLAADERAQRRENLNQALAGSDSGPASANDDEGEADALGADR